MPLLRGEVGVGEGKKREVQNCVAARGKKVSPAARGKKSKKVGYPGIF